jgi:hypothetical protein
MQDGPSIRGSARLTQSPQTPTAYEARLTVHTSHKAAQSSMPSYAEIALAAIMRADAVVWAERNEDAAEAIRRVKIRDTLTGTKQSPDHIAKRVAAVKAARARSLAAGVRRRAQSQSRATVSPVVSKPRRTAHA